MTDEANNLTPAKPVAPRRRLPANPRMAQPVADPQPEEAPKPQGLPDALMTDLPASLSPKLVEEEAPSDPAAEVAEVAPAAEATPVDPVVEVGPIAPGAPIPEEAAVAEQARLAEVTPLAPVVEVATVAEAVKPTPPEPVAVVEPEPAPRPEAPIAQPEPDFPRTVRDTLSRVDEAWAAFRAAAIRFPSERVDERLSEDGWTRKQMLEHVAAWHDLTADRLVKLINTDASVPLDVDTDKFNARVARTAIGKTSGEVLKDMDATFNRLRRQMARLTDAQLQIDDWWAAWVIGGNTYAHYEEHWADIYTPELPPGGRSRR